MNGLLVNSYSFAASQYDNSITRDTETIKFTVVDIVVESRVSYQRYYTMFGESVYMFKGVELKWTSSNNGKVTSFTAAGYMKADLYEYDLSYTTQIYPKPPIFTNFVASSIASSTSPVKINYTTIIAEQLRQTG